MLVCLCKLQQASCYIHPSLHSLHGTTMVLTAASSWLNTQCSSLRFCVMSGTTIAGSWTRLHSKHQTGFRCFQNGLPQHTFHDPASHACYIPGTSVYEMPFALHLAMHVSSMQQQDRVQPLCTCNGHNPIHPTKLVTLTLWQSSASLPSADQLTTKLETVP